MGERYEKMSVVELRRLAISRGLPGRSEMRKAELIDALQEDSLQEQINELRERVERLEGRDQDG